MENTAIISLFSLILSIISIIYTIFSATVSRDLKIDQKNNDINYQNNKDDLSNMLAIKSDIHELIHSLGNEVFRIKTYYTSKKMDEDIKSKISKLIVYQKNIDKISEIKLFIINSELRMQIIAVEVAWNDLFKEKESAIYYIDSIVKISNEIAELEKQIMLINQKTHWNEKNIFDINLKTETSD